MHSVHVHMRPTTEAKFGGPPHWQTQKIVNDIYLETQSFSFCIIVQLGTERRILELARFSLWDVNNAKQAAIRHSKMQKF